MGFCRSFVDSQTEAPVREASEAERHGRVSDRRLETIIGKRHANKIISSKASAGTCMRGESEATKENTSANIEDEGRRKRAT